MVRAPYFDKSGTKRGAWSEDEDNKLRAYIEKYGHQNWRKLPKFAGLSRCGKSCRLRWMNYLRPNVKHGNFTKEEDDLIINLHKNLGNKWSVISSKLQGRSDNEIKNHWHAYLKSRVKQNIFVSDSKNENVQDPKLDERKSIIKISMLKEKDEDKILQTILSSESSSNANNERSSSSSSNNLDIMASNEGSSQSFKEELTGDFWTEPFLMESCSSISNEYLMTPMDLVNTYVFSSSGLDMTVFNDILW